ncbi:MAG: VanZ family protein [Oscillospiraceae bacterium]
MHRIEAYVRLALIFIGVIAVLYLPVLFYLKKRGKSALRQLGVLGLGCSLFLIVFATILFVPITVFPAQHVLNLRPFAWVDTVDTLSQFIVEKVPNVLLFVPVFLPIVFGGLRKREPSVSALPSPLRGIFQYFIGRSSDIDDIIMNLWALSPAISCSGCCMASERNKVVEILIGCR